MAALLSAPPFSLYNIHKKMNNSFSFFVIIMNRRCYCMKKVLSILAIITVITSLPVYSESKIESVKTDTTSTIEKEVVSNGEVKTNIKRVHHRPRTVIFYGSPPPPYMHRRFPYRDYRFNWTNCMYYPHYGCYGPTFNSGIFFRF